MSTVSDVSMETAALTVIRVQGDAGGRGRAQGEVLRDLIAEGVGRWLEAIGHRHAIDPDAYIEEFLFATGHVEAMRRLTPDTLAEIEGIAAGSVQSLGRILAYNLLDEEWEYGEGRGTRESPGCTAGGFLSQSGSVVIGQTMDIPSVHDGTQTVVVHERVGQPDMMVFTAAGMVGLMGLNDAGVGVVVNNLAMLPSSKSGLPVAAVARGVIDHESAEAATAFVERVPHAIGQHYLIGGEETLTSLEADATGVSQIPSLYGSVVHTNHPLADSWKVPETETWALANSRRRFERMAELTVRMSDETGLQTALSDTLVPISRPPVEGFMTFGAMVANLDGGCARFTAGPPHMKEWVDVAFT